MVDVQALDHFPVEVQQALGAHGVPHGVAAGFQLEKELAALLGGRGGKGDVEPVVGVLPADGVLPAPGHPVPLRRRIGRFIACGQVGDALQRLRFALAEEGQLLNDHANFFG